MTEALMLIRPVPTMSSREIAELCEKRHDNVIRDIRSMLDELKIAHLNFEGSYIDASGRELSCFNLDKELTMTLVAGYNVTLRHRIVKRWLELETAPRELTRLEIIQMAMESEQARLVAEQKLLAARPAIQHHEAVQAAINDISFLQMSRILIQAGHKIGRNNLIALLRDAGVLIRSKGNDRNTPTQAMMERGYFRVVESIRTSEAGKTLVQKTTYVTGKGECWIMENYSKLQERANNRIGSTSCRTI